ncbi:hypothetical protein L3X38_008654 [Prunus dulcis]|uniref:Retrotransposon gag domain-containing protein n=1 Tax=Prunus dulcis TaxID=3755 RepID=A0AAD5F776_PRUDU|nr:hypothetical protein L3X38_008654 [Prunus dulcis]
MHTNLMLNFIQCQTAKGVWDTVKKACCDASDSSQVYELMKKSVQLRQNGWPLSTYFTEMNSLFMELDNHRPNDLENPSNIAKLKKRTSKEHVYIFLADLDHNLD